MIYAIIPFEPGEKLRSNIDGLDVPRLRRGSTRRRSHDVHVEEERRGT